MASGPITSWEIDRETVETVSDFIFLGSKITADGGCSHEIKRCLLLRRKVMTSLDSILKSRDITLPTKVHLVKAMVFPVVMYGCESWIVKKAECRKTDAFELWCWRRLLRVPWTAKEIQPVHPKRDQSWVFIGRNWCWSWNSSTLAISCEELTHWKRPWFWEGLGAGGEGDDRGWDGWMASPNRWAWVWVNSGSWDGQGGLAPAIHGVAKSQTRLSNWIELIDREQVTRSLNNLRVIYWCYGIYYHLIGFYDILFGNLLYSLGIHINNFIPF